MARSLRSEVKKSHRSKNETKSSSSRIKMDNTSFSSSLSMKKKRNYKYKTITEVPSYLCLRNGRQLIPLQDRQPKEIENEFNKKNKMNKEIINESKGNGVEVKRENTIKQLKDKINSKNKLHKQSIMNKKKSKTPKPNSVPRKNKDLRINQYKFKIGIRLHKKNIKTGCKGEKEKLWIFQQTLQLSSFNWPTSNSSYPTFFNKIKQFQDACIRSNVNCKQTAKEKSAFDRLMERYLSSKEHAKKKNTESLTPFQLITTAKSVKKNSMNTIVTCIDGLGGVGDISSLNQIGNTDSHHSWLSKVCQSVAISPHDNSKPSQNCTMNESTCGNINNDKNSPKGRKKINVFSMTEEEVKVATKNWILKNGETLLHKAAKVGNLNVVQYCLEILHSSLTARDKAGYTPLHIACSRGRYQVVKLLLKCGANANDPTFQGIRPLHVATENEHTRVIKLLLDQGADPQSADYSGVTPLMMASGKVRSLMESYISHHPPSKIKEEKDSAGSSQSNIQNADGDSVITSNLDGIEIEESTFPLPSLYKLSTESESDSWVFFHELFPHLKVKTRKVLLKQLVQDAKLVFRDLCLSDFHEKARCRAIVPPDMPKTSKVTLVKYTDQLKHLLGIETTIIPSTENSQESTIRKPCTTSGITSYPGQRSLMNNNNIKNNLVPSQIKIGKYENYSCQPAVLPKHFKQFFWAIKKEHSYSLPNLYQLMTEQRDNFLCLDNRFYL